MALPQDSRVKNGTTQRYCVLYRVNAGNADVTGIAPTAIGIRERGQIGGHYGSVLGRGLGVSRSHHETGGAHGENQKVANSKLTGDSMERSLTGTGWLSPGTT